MCVPAQDRTILIVEDDDDIRGLLEDLLQGAGYHVVSAASGQQARALIAALPVAGVLLDNRLPDTSGLELCGEFCMQRGRPVPIFFLTADHEAGLEARVFAAGATGFLHKPFNLDALLSLLAAYIPR